MSTFVMRAFGKMSARIAIARTVVPVLMGYVLSQFILWALPLENASDRETVAVIEQFTVAQSILLYYFFGTVLERRVHRNFGFMLGHPSLPFYHWKEYQSTREDDIFTAKLHGYSVGMSTVFRTLREVDYETYRKLIWGTSPDQFQKMLSSNDLELIETSADGVREFRIVTGKSGKDARLVLDMRDQGAPTGE